MIQMKQKSLKNCHLYSKEEFCTWKAEKQEAQRERAAVSWECFVIVLSRLHGLKNKESATGKPPKSNRQKWNESGTYCETHWFTMRAAMNDRWGNWQVAPGRALFPTDSMRVWGFYSQHTEQKRVLILQVSALNRYF